jgi:uncharacterized protein (DUF1697 family)
VRTHLALLRGINVGGRNKVAMADLRAVVASLGHRDVATYIQSGNVVFTAQDTTPAALAASLATRIAETLEVRPKVVVLARDELGQVIADNPYPGQTNPRCLHAMFRNEPLEPGEVAEIAAAEQRARAKGGRDEARVIGRTVFLHTPDGFGRSELAALLNRPSTRATAAATARNWATVTKLMALLDS